MALIEWAMNSEGVSQRVRRPFRVPAQISDLHGPSTGVLADLPVHLNWTPITTYDLSNPTYVHEIYGQLLAVATESELAEFVNPELLIASWSTMVIPPAIRAEWERRFPELQRQLTHA